MPATVLNHYVRQGVSGGDGDAFATAWNITEAVNYYSTRAVVVGTYDRFYLCGNLTFSSTVTIPSTTQTLASARGIWQGRDGVDGTTDQQIVITAPSSGNCWVPDENYQIFRQITVSGAVGAAWAATFSSQHNHEYYLCNALNCGAGFVYSSIAGGFNYVRCGTFNCTTSGFIGPALGNTINPSSAVECTAYNCGLDGFLMTGSAIRCLSYENNGAGFVGVKHALACTAYDNLLGGYVYAGQHGAFYVDCLAVKNGVCGYRTDDLSGTLKPFLNLVRCGSAINGSNPPNDVRLVRASGDLLYDEENPGVTTDPFVDAAAGDFRLNDVATGGLKCKESIGIVVPGCGTSYHDRGAVQKLGPTGADATVFSGSFINRGVNA